MYITSEEILKEISEIGNFKGSLDSKSGTLEWYNEQNGITIYGTPSWETDGEIPFDVYFNDEVEILNVCVVRLTNESKTNQLLRYINVVSMIINHYNDTK
jgi:hypothetical protein